MSDLARRRSGITQPCLSSACVDVLRTAEARCKAAAARRVACDWLSRRLAEPGGTATASVAVAVPDRPARPASPELKRPRDVPRRKIGPAPEGRIALLHALAHIELNAIDLAFDIVARFGGEARAAGLPDTFLDDWIAIGDDEARHFLMLDDRLRVLGAGYGDLPAHDGLWRAAMETADDLLARLAVVPMVLEARGLDVTPAMIEKLHAAGDGESATALQVIHNDEIGHVAAGRRWFEALCAARGLDPVPTWQELIRKRFKGALKPPFNAESRALAGFDEIYYGPLAAE